jgi:hypothetical protein
VRSIRARIEVFERKNGGKFVSFNYGMVPACLSGDAGLEILRKLFQCVSDRRKDAHARHNNSPLHGLDGPFGCEMRGNSTLVPILVNFNEVEIGASLVII